MPVRKIRYAVVGLGHIVQAAVLPAFRHAAKNSGLAALVSSDDKKLTELGKRYDVERLVGYDGYEALLRSGDVDAVYIGLPNDMHRKFTVAAARAGVHVLCEKPMAVTEGDCAAMIAAAAENKVKLMIAYRLHFEPANLRAIEVVQSGKLGQARIFDSVFTMQVRGGDIRLQQERGGGPLYDIGIYCINASRYLFRAEPIEVVAFSSRRDAKGEDRFDEVDEMTSAILRFPGERLATFTCSFGAADVSSYQVVGTKGDLRVDPAYDYAGERRHVLTIGGKSRKRKFEKSDQFAPELVYFSRCIVEDREPEPSGEEGLIDVRVVRALQQSLRTGKPTMVHGLVRKRRPSLEQEIVKPPVRKPKLVDVESPST